MTKLQALEWYMEQVADTYRHWFPDHASRENDYYIRNWLAVGAISGEWEQFLISYNKVLYSLYEYNEYNVQIDVLDLKTR